MDLVRRQPLEGHAVGVGRRLDDVESGQLARFGCGDQLSDPGVRNVVAAAEVVEAVPTFDAQNRLERPSRIVDAGMDDLTVPAGRLHAVTSLAFEDDESGVVRGQPRRDRQADDAGSDDDDPGVGHSAHLKGGHRRRF